MPWSRIETESLELAGAATGADDRILGYADAIREALDLALDRDPRVFVMGQGVDDPSGMFGASLDLHEKYGAQRVFDTPLAEASLMGIAMGAALGDMRPVYMHNRPDFLLLAMDQLAGHASKWHYMFGGAMSVPLTVWTCIGRGWGSGAQHSQSLQGLFMQFPGLKLVMPSTPYDAKGLMIAAIADENPVLIIEHRFNFRYKGPVPEGIYQVPIGKAVVRRAGRDVTLVGASHMALEAQWAADELALEGIDAEVVDLRSLRPLDEACILESVAKTGRLVVADTDRRAGGVVAEVAAVVAESGFASLRAPVARVTNADVPTPSGYTLEEGFYAGKDDIVAAARKVVAWKA